MTVFVSTRVGWRNDPGRNTISMLGRRKQQTVWNESYSVRAWIYSVSVQHAYCSASLQYLLARDADAPLFECYGVTVAIRRFGLDMTGSDCDRCVGKYVSVNPHQEIQLAYAGNVAKKDSFCPALTKPAVSQFSFLHTICNSKFAYPIEKLILIMFYSCQLCTWALCFLVMGGPLNFGNLSYTAAFLCGVYCIPYIAHGVPKIRYLWVSPF